MPELNDIMEFEHVIEVREDGSIIDRDDIYAPDCYCDGRAGVDGIGNEWAPLNGYSGQDRYAGPIMHESEYIGGRMETDIRATPGIYVAVVVMDLENATEAETPDCGWAVLKREDGKS